MAYAAFAEYAGASPAPGLPKIKPPTPTPTPAQAPMAAFAVPAPDEPSVPAAPPAPPPPPAAPTPAASPAPPPAPDPYKNNPTYTGLDPAVQTAMGLPAAAAATQTTLPGYTAPPPTPGQFDITTDPGFMLGKSQGIGQRGGAASDYLKSVEDSLLGFGSQELAHKVLDGMLPELEGYMQAAGTLKNGAHLDLNPFYESFYLHDAQGNKLLGPDGKPLTVADKDQGFSQLAQQNRTSFNNARSAIDQNRLANLGYSTAGARNLADTAYNSQLGLNNAATGENNLLNQFLQSYHGGLTNATTTENSAAQAAYDRAVQIALANKTGATVTPPPTTSGTGGAGTNIVHDNKPGTPAEIAAASEAALKKAQAAGEDPAAAALAARSAGMNALHNLGDYAPAPSQPSGPQPTGTPAQVAAASETALKAAQAQGAPAPTAALDARSAGLNALYKLGDFVPKPAAQPEAPARYYTTRAQVDAAQKKLGGTVKFTSGKGYYLG